MSGTVAAQRPKCSHLLHPPDRSVGSCRRRSVSTVLSREKSVLLIGAKVCRGRSQSRAARSAVRRTRAQRALLTVIFVRRNNARREEGGPAGYVDAVTMGALEREPPALRGAGVLAGGSAAPGGLPPVGRGRLPPRSRRLSLLPRPALAVIPSRQLAIPSAIPASSHAIRGRASARPGAPWRALDHRKESPHRIRVKRAIRAPLITPSRASRTLPR